MIRVLLAATILLLARPAFAGWDDFRIIMWADQTPAQMAGLRKLGVSALRVTGQREGTLDPAEIAARLAPLQAAGLGFYVENIATDFYAPYHRFLPDHPGQPNWLFEQARARYRANPSDLAGLRREPSLSDEVWQSRIRARLAAHVRAYNPAAPLFYNLGDEVGIADLAAPWDFDFSPVAITKFRASMRSAYGNIDRLNFQWSANFASFDEVMPDTTAQAMRRADANYSSWSDFRAWMDLAFAQALRLGTDAVHASAQGALAGIEGAQAPGSGGYDYALLPYAVDVMEGADDTGLMVARGVNPALITLTTSFDGGAAEVGRIWRSAMAGARGLIIWDADKTFVGPTGTPSPRAESLAPMFAELTAGLGAQLIASPPVIDRVGILYSPASQRIRWMLDHQPKGEAWRDARNLSEAEAPDQNAGLQSLVRIERALLHVGVRARIITPAMLARGGLRNSGLRLLILPQTIVLSVRESEEIIAFANAGGAVAADGLPGTYDEHGRRLTGSQLAPLMRYGKVLRLPPAVLADADASSPTALDGMLGLLTEARAKPDYRMLAGNAQPVGDVELRRWRTGDVVLVGLIRTAGSDKTAQADRVIDLVVSPGDKIYDLRQHALLEHGAKLTLRLAPNQPVFLALSPTTLPSPSIIAPFAVQVPGTSAVWTLRRPLSPAQIHVVRLEILGPDGAIRPAFTTNLPVGDVPLDWVMAIPGDAAEGTWTARITDMLSGGTSQATMQVKLP